MKAVILAAGRGTRLQPLTETVPKPMVNFRGVPLLEYTLSILPDQINEIVLVVGWLGDKIRHYFGASFSGRRIKYVIQLEPRGTFHALSQAENILAGDDFLVVSGDDVYCAKDLAKVASSSSLCLLANKTRQPERFGICILDEGGFLLDIVEKPEVFCGDLANIGVYKLNHTIFKEPVSIGVSGEELLAPMIGSLASSQKIEIIQASFWHPIADLEDLKRAQKIVI